MTYWHRFAGDLETQLYLTVNLTGQYNGHIMHSETERQWDFPAVQPTPVASLRFVSPGAVTDGVTLFLPESWVEQGLMSHQTHRS